MEQAQTINWYLNKLGWSQRELSRRSRLDYNTVLKVMRHEKVAKRTGLAIAEAFADGLGQRVLVSDISDLVL